MKMRHFPALLALGLMLGGNAVETAFRERPRLAPSRTGARAVHYDRASYVDTSRLGARRKRRLRNQAARALRGAV